MVQARLATLSVLLATVLAGCASSEGSSDPLATSVEPLPDAGTLSGSVTDDALVPIVGAQVALLETSIATTTDETGFFQISNLAPGDYNLAVAALGFDSIAQFVTVEPNAEVPVSVILQPIAVEDPYVEVIGPETWYFECRLGTPVLTGPCGAVSLPNDKASLAFNATEDVQDWVGEMRWAPGSFATSKALRLSFSYTDRTSSHWFCTATSESPVSFHYDVTILGDLEDNAYVKEHREEGCVTEPYCGIASSQLNDDEPWHPFDLDREGVDEDAQLLIYTNTPFGCAQPDPTHAVELSLQQRLETMLTMFHGQHKPADYTAFPDQ